MLSVEANIRGKNQVTVPEVIASRLGITAGDRIVFELDEDAPDEVTVRAIRRSYAGALAGVYGNEEEARKYLQEERSSWGE
ncbi:MAG: AbrB/MazE/SpoVT family DNA-binding domain-containing protein [Chloroflexota bacterium]